MWRTGYDPERLDDLERFAKERSTPMFESFAGCLGHIYSHDDESFLTISLWIGRHAIKAAEASELYRETVSALERTGVLRGSQTVEVLKVSSLNMGWGAEPDDDVWDG